MRLPRLTYRGAFHHVTSRGINGEKILGGDSDKRCFLELLAKKSKLNGIRVFAYCLMDNHYHLIIENSSGRLSHFLRQLNGQYGMRYRKKTESQGYVFQNRFYSSLIQDEAYLTLAIKYVLLNPVKAGLTKDAAAYPWSSASAYFSKSGSDQCATHFVEGLFGSRLALIAALHGSIDAKLPLVKTRFGPVIGNEDFLDKAADKFDRREPPEASKGMGAAGQFFVPVDKVVHEFEAKHRIKTGKIDCSTHAGKRLRGELLVWLHDLAGLTYSEIAEFPLFSGLKSQSLGHLYQKARRRADEKVKN